MVEHDPTDELNIGLLLYIPYRALESQVFVALAEAGFNDLTPSQARVFQRISAHGTRLTDLAEQASITKQAAGFLVDQLERAGYVAGSPTRRMPARGSSPSANAVTGHSRSQLRSWRTSRRPGPGTSVNDACGSYVTSSSGSARSPIRTPIGADPQGVGDPAHFVRRKVARPLDRTRTSLRAPTKFVERRALPATTCRRWSINARSPALVGRLTATKRGNRPQRSHCTVRSLRSSRHSAQTVTSLSSWWQ